MYQIFQLINAGDGAGQHPTQALLDLYTIEREIKKIDGVTIVMVGDLKNGRTVRSLCYLLGKYKDCRIYFVSPQDLRIGNDIKEYLTHHRIVFEETDSLAQALGIADVVYQTRIQKERFATEAEYLKHKGCYVLDKANTQHMKSEAIIMHPLPRVDEISIDLDGIPKAAYFRQAGYGLLVRMALLYQLLA